MSSSDTPSNDPPAGGKPSADKTAGNKPAPDKTSADKPSGGKPATGKPGGSGAAFGISRVKLYGALVILVIALLLAAVGTYPSWRASLASALDFIGVEVAALERGLGVPHWIITHEFGDPSPEAKAQNVPGTGPGSDPVLDMRLSEFEQRLTALEGRFADVADSPDRLTALDERIAALETGGAGTAETPPRPSGADESGQMAALAERVKVLEHRLGDAPEKLTKLQRRMDALTALSDEVSALSAKLNDWGPDREKATLTLFSVSQLSLAASGTGGYETQLAALRSVAGERMAEPLTIMAAHAAAGTPNIQHLRGSFAAMAGAVVQARDYDAEAGLVRQALLRIAALVTVRRTDEAQNETVDGALARAAMALEMGDLAGAVAALGTLSGRPADAASGWLSGARARIAVDAALTILRTEALHDLDPDSATDPATGG